MSDGQTTGGTQWELETAGKAMAAARHAGDVDGEVAALLRFSEGLRNSSLGVVGQVIKPLSSDMAEQRKALDTLVTTMQHISVVVAQIAAAQKKTDERLAAIEDRLDHKRERLDAHDARLDALERNNARLEALEATVKRLEARNDT